MFIHHFMLRYNYLILARFLAFAVVALRELWRPGFPVAIAPTALRSEEPMEKATFL